MQLIHLLYAHAPDDVLILSSGRRRSGAALRAAQVALRAETRLCVEHLTALVADAEGTQQSAPVGTKVSATFPKVSSRAHQPFQVFTCKSGNVLVRRVAETNVHPYTSSSCRTSCEVL